MIAPGSALSVARQAKLLGVSRSSVYYRPRPDSQEELDLLKRLDELFTENPVYGSRRLQQMLKREGVRVGRRRIRRLMRELGLGGGGAGAGPRRPVRCGERSSSVGIPIPPRLRRATPMAAPCGSPRASTPPRPAQSWWIDAGGMNERSDRV